MGVMNGGGSSNGDSLTQGDTVQDTINSLRQRLPDEFEMVSLSLKAKPLLQGPAGPYTVVALQECGRMNTLLKEIKRSLNDLDKGLKGHLNMSPEMEDLVTALQISQWPGRDPFSKCSWERLAWPSKKNLFSQFSDMILRIEQLRDWISNLEIPKSIWLSGLFNPSSYLTAVQQATARKTGISLDKMTIETHATSMLDKSEVKDHAVNGTFIHGLFIEGAVWSQGNDPDENFDVEGTKCSGHLSDCRLKELISPMPVIYVKAIPIKSEWEASPVGYLRNKPSIYECPVYSTSFRGPNYVFLATLKTSVPTSKWVLSGCALLLETDS